MPAVEVFLPPGVTLSGASYEGQSLAQLDGGATPTATNPVTTEAVAGPAGTTLTVIRFPLSSLSPSAPNAVLDLQLALASDAALGTSQTLSASCLYAFGTNAVIDPMVDPPIRSDDPAVAGDEAVAVFTPTVVRLTQDISPARATGPSFPADLVYTLDVASGAQVDSLGLDAILDDRFQVTGVTITPPLAGTLLAPMLPTALPGGRVEVDFLPLTGAAGADVTITVSGFIPQSDAASMPVLLAASGQSVLVDAGSVSLSGGLYRAPGGDVMVPTVSAAPDDLLAQSLRLTESISNVSRPGSTFRPGDIARVGLEACASDFFPLTGVTVTSTLPAGLQIRAGAVPAPSSGAGTANPQFALGNLAAGTCGTVTYELDILETYAPGQSVLTLDVIDPLHDARARLASGQSILTNERESRANADIRLAGSTFSTSIGLVNGVPPAAPIIIRAGDQVRFVLSGTINSGDAGAVRLTSYLPIPLFNAEEFGISPPFGPATNIQLSPGSDPAVSIASVAARGPEGAVELNLSSVSTTPSAPVSFEIFLDFTAQPALVEDGLELVTLLAAEVDGTLITASSVALAGLRVGAPDLRVLAAALATVGGGRIAPAPVLPPYDSTGLVTASPDSDAVDVDGNDLVDFVFLIENRDRKMPCPFSRKKCCRQVSHWCPEASASPTAQGTPRWGPRAGASPRGPSS